MKILVIFTGGTIGSCYNDGIISTDSSTRYRLIEMYKKYGGNDEFETISPYTVLSENLDGEHFNLLYNSIKENINKGYDGIIVTHGTDTLQYTSAMLSYMFGLCKTPIVLVSANYPLESKKSNGFDNFKSAVRFIRSNNNRGVFVAYKNHGETAKIHRGSRLQKHLAYNDNIYSVKNEFYGEITDNEFIKNTYYNEKADELTIENMPKFKTYSPVLKIAPYVGMTYPHIEKSTKAVLLESYHSGTIYTSSKILERFCNKAKEFEIPIFLTGSEAGFFYESKELFAKLSIKILPPVSPVSAYIKLWLLCENNAANLYDNFTKSLGGDILY